MSVRSQPLKDHWKEQRLFLSRIIGSAVAVVLLTGLLIWRLVDLQVLEYQRFSQLSQDNQISIEPLAPNRGVIYDRANRIIAENVPTWQLVAVPEQVGDLASLDDILARLEKLELLEPADRPVLIERMRSHRRFERVTLTNLTELQAAVFAVRRHQFPGVHIQEGLIRYYRYGEAAAHAIGYVSMVSTSDLERIDRANYSGNSQIGKIGVERFYEEQLHGRTGYQHVVVNVQGRPSNETVPEGSLERKLPEPGDNLFLTLDMKLQQAAYEALSSAHLRGAAVAIDPRNGDVLTLVSTPSFDPNKFATGMSQAEYLELSTDPDKPFLNRAIGEKYNPGSTVKPFYGLAGLHYETQYVAEEHFCAGEFRLPGSSQVYREPRRVLNHLETDLHSAIVRSCNVYFYGLAVELGIDRMEAFMRGFGFGSRTGIDIGGELTGLVPGREWKRTAFRAREDQTWFPGETVITGIGQGYIEVTPLQLAHATATMAARGARYQPRLLLAAEDPETGNTEDAPAIVIESLADVSEEHWQFIHDAMFGVTTELRGTGRTAMLEAGYPVAGKTGTAQVVGVAQGEVYDEEIEERFRDNGLFIAFAPVQDPRIAIAVVVENNGGGGSTAAPIARQVLDAYFGTEDYVAQLVTF